MAEAVIHELPEGVGQEQYDPVSEKLNPQGDPPQGLLARFAGAITAVAQASGREVVEADHTWWSLHSVVTP